MVIIALSEVMSPTSWTSTRMSGKSLRRLLRRTSVFGGTPGPCGPVAPWGGVRLLPAGPVARETAPRSRSFTEPRAPPSDCRTTPSAPCQPRARSTPAITDCLSSVNGWATARRSPTAKTPTCCPTRQCSLESRSPSCGPSRGSPRARCRRRERDSADPPERRQAPRATGGGRGRYPVGEPGLSSLAHARGATTPRPGARRSSKTCTSAGVRSSMNLPCLSRTTKSTETCSADAPNSWGCSLRSSGTAAMPLAAAATAAMASRHVLHGIMGVSPAWDLERSVVQ